MASTLTKILIHFAFSTRNRDPLIPAALESDLYSYVGGICRRFESPLLSMGGTHDHVHMLVSLSKNASSSGLMLDVKRDSSKWLKQHAGREFGWQDGYFGFSIGESGVVALRAYIARQKDHHATVDFKDEMRTIMRKYNTKWDERYVWD